MSSVDRIVEFAAELTFETEHGCGSTTPPGTAEIRVASKLTVVATDAHGRTVSDLRRLFDRLLDDRTGLFDTVRIDCCHPATTAGIERELWTHVEKGWADTTRVGMIDSLYEYEIDRLLLTPERYPDVAHSELEVGSDTLAEASETI